MTRIAKPSGLRLAALAGCCALLPSAPSRAGDGSPPPAQTAPATPASSLAAGTGRMLMTLPPLFDIRAAVPPGCDAARQQAADWLALLEARIPSPVKGQAAVYVLTDQPGMTPAKAWSDLAAGALLAGRCEIAAWAGLKAATIEWSGANVANAGVYLVQDARCADGLLLLHCAQSMGFNSPYLFEAIATASMRNHDTAAAKEAIEQAAAADPGDPLINYEQSQITQGKPPPPPPPPPPASDPIAYALQVLDRLAAQVEQAFRAGAEQGVRLRRVEGITEGPGNPVQTALDVEVRQIRGLMDSLHATAGKALGPATVPGMNGPLPAAAAEALQHARWNAFFELAAREYCSLIRQLLEVRIVGSDEQEGVFWAQLLRMDAEEFAREINTVRHAKHAYLTGRDIADVAIAYYADAAEEASNQRYERDLVCGRENYNNPAAEAACHLEVAAEYCRTLRQILDQSAAQAQQRFQLAGRNFDRTAWNLLDWSGGQVRQAHGFCRWATGKMKLRAGNAPDQAALQRVKVAYRRLVTYTFSEQDSGPAAFIRTQADRFVIDRRNEEARQQGLAREIAKTCAPIERRELEQLAEEQARAYREFLLEKLMEDFEVEWSDKVKCEGSIGPFGVELDDSGKVTGLVKWTWLKGDPFGGTEEGSAGEEGAEGEGVEVKVGPKAEVSYHNGQVVGVAVGAGGSGEYGPFVGKFHSTLEAERNEQTGEWEKTVALGGTLGVGGEFPGGAGEAACFPGSLNVNFSPRAVMDDAAAWYAANAGGG